MAQPKNKIVRGVRATVLGFIGVVGLFIGVVLMLGVIGGILWGIVSLISIAVGDHEWFVIAGLLLVIIAFLSYFGLLVITLSRSIYLRGFRKGVKHWFEVYGG